MNDYKTNESNNRIDGNFENLHILIHSVRIDTFHSIINPLQPDNLAYTDIWEDVNFTFSGNDLLIAGKVNLFLRNQAENDNTVMFAEFKLNAKAANESDKSSAFAKLVQYLFEVIDVKTKKKEITSLNNGEFIIPGFPYSKNSFERHF